MTIQQLQSAALEARKNYLRTTGSGVADAYDQWDLAEKEFNEGLRREAAAARIRATLNPPRPSTGLRDVERAKREANRNKNRLKRLAKQPKPGSNQEIPDRGGTSRKARQSRRRRERSRH